MMANDNSLPAWVFENSVIRNMNSYNLKLGNDKNPGLDSGLDEL